MPAPKQFEFLKRKEKDFFGENLEKRAAQYRREALNSFNVRLSYAKRTGKPLPTIPTLPSVVMPQ